MSRWTLWIEVLCAMMLSSAGGPSLAQPWRWPEKKKKKKELKKNNKKNTHICGEELQKKAMLTT